MLALSVFHAIKDAVAAVANHGLSPKLNAPATPEEVLRSVEEVSIQSERSKLEC